ncbi:MAG: flagellar basal-body rod protein FlgG [Proteobacteria bacterium]|nr:flagellar basal-body rod protein FlgG [Pseudomonadota bacterium]MBU1388936.1 flagellar basal-body rod protein FlgG [Pseudomonadota bacterium]MBU1543488.1 flagellar basal-body rod protein FlgG [Pseudomonadota bacterium]MBU2431636.1 flagellar basal-body rod protein FlgG [Pseudomonadota bacterium]MBU2482635.1 flagellar basal-body rod protein FlgG [Pseudomonadota bacterium]
MIRALWSAATGMNAQQMQTDVVANNLANASTTGFKKSRANFEDLMYATMQVAGQTTPGGGQVPTGIQVGMGVKPTSVQKLFTQGDYIQTDNQLDMAIQGNGFFRVLHGDEELYTRAGNFTMDSEGFLTTPSGDRLQPEITLPAETVTVTLQDNGTLTAHGANEAILATENILITTFINPAGLFAVGNNLFRVTEGSGDPVEGTPGDEGFGTVVNNYLEGSNVSVVEEIVSMIAGQRAYEANSKSIQTADSMLGTANGLKR